MGKLMKIKLKMEEELYFIIMGNYIKVSLKIILNRVMELKFIQMVLFIQANLNLEKEMAKVDFNGQMDKFMMDNGKII
jgi:hypothetical protein